VSAELADRRNAAAAVLADYQREVAAILRTPGIDPEWSLWASRLAAAVCQLLEFADDQGASLRAATFVLPDGSATLSPADLDTVLGALADSAGWHEYRASLTCPDCDVSPDGLCDEHAQALDLAGIYGSVARRLGAS
jgi:hypothetical protein